MTNLSPLRPSTPSTLAAQVASQASANPKFITVPAPGQPAAPPELLEWESQCRNEVGKLRNALVGIAYYGSRLAASGKWAALGYESEDAFRESLGISEAYWSRCLKLGERLGHLSLADMRDLTVTAAESLARVDMRLWDDYAWVDEARMLAPGDFQRLVIQRNASVTHAAIKEPKAVLSLSLPVSHKPGLEVRIESVRRQAHVKSSAEAIDYALGAAEREAEILQQVAQVRRQVEALTESWQVELRESAEEREARLESGQPSVASTILSSRKLTLAILKSIKEILPDAPDPQAVP